jgi:hypothetical protein
MIPRKRDEPLQKDISKKNTDKVWCPDGGHYRYVEVCKASCTKANRCEAYAEYREPRLI